MRRFRRPPGTRMSEQHNEEHETFIKTPKQLIIVVLLAFIVPIALIVMLTQLVMTGSSASTAQSEEAVARRIKPVGEVVVVDPNAPRADKTGQQVVEQVCAACHATGALKAPKIGDKAAWAPLIKEGLDHLTQTAIKGIRQMPARGGNPDLSDTEMARAVAYMANQSGASFKEPEAKPAAKPAATVTAAAPAAAAAAPAAGGKADAGKGKQVYDTVCAACHSAGVAGAPKTGDKAAWGPRIKAGNEALYTSAIKGKGAMPAKGGNPALADADIKAAVDFMVGQSK